MLYNLFCEASITLTPKLAKTLEKKEKKGGKGEGEEGVITCGVYLRNARLV